jgi:hypothetical protein
MITNDFKDNIMFVNEQIDDAITKLSNSMAFQYDQYVKDGYSVKNIKNNRNMVTIIFGMSKMLLKISDDSKNKFLDYISKVKSLGTFEIIIVDSVDNLKKQEYNVWYKGTVEDGNGIWIGSGIADQSLIKTNIGFKKVNNELPEGYGVVVKGSKTYLVNLITSDIDTTQDNITDSVNSNQKENVNQGDEVL